LHLKSWLNDTPVLYDALEIVAEKYRTLWWGQQLDLAMIPWSMLLSIEGHRRKIPHLWAYALLPHLVSLSFAQNLFYVALLLTPSPIVTAEEPDSLSALFHRIFPRKPATWTPKPFFYIINLILSYVIALWVPYTAGKHMFGTAVTILRVLTFLPVALPTILPRSLGTDHSHQHDTYRSIVKIFRGMALASTLFHARTSILALFFSLPKAYKHRHSIHLPFDTLKVSAWDRSATALERILGSMSDHPAVAAAGKDVLLCALSLGLWAAFRSMDVQDVLRSAGVPEVVYKTSHAVASEARHLKEEAHLLKDKAGDKISSEAQHLKEKASDKISSAKSELRHRLHSTHSEDEDEEPSSQQTNASTASPEFSMTLRRRGRQTGGSSHSRVSSIGSTGSPLVTKTTVADAGQTPSRRRGRPRKVKAEPEPGLQTDLYEEEEKHENDPEEVPGDRTYEPTPAEMAGLQEEEVDIIPEDDFDSESAALAWGLTALGGLGVGCAGIYGAECVSR